jgi:recombination protein RecA
MSTDREQKLKIIEDAITSIERTYGKGSIMKLGDGVINQVESIPTGALSLDYALGIGGIPRGRVTEVYGPESSGKTFYHNLILESRHWKLLIHLFVVMLSIL